MRRVFVNGDDLQRLGIPEDGCAADKNIGDALGFAFRQLKLLSFFMSSRCSMDGIDLYQVLNRHVMAARATIGSREGRGFASRQELAVVILIARVFPLRAATENVNEKPSMVVGPFERGKQAGQSLLAIEDEIFIAAVSCRFEIENLNSFCIHIAGQPSEPLNGRSLPKHYRANGKTAEQAIDQAIDAIVFPNKRALHGGEHNVIAVHLGEQSKKCWVKHA